MFFMLPGPNPLTVNGESAGAPLAPKQSTSISDTFELLFVARQ